MVTHVRIGSVENRYALTRLVGKAREDGIRLYRNPRDGRHYASSASEPGKLHYVTGYSCDCRGFMTHQRCKHYAALMAAMGWLSDEPEPAAAAALTPCGECAGHGQVSSTIGTGPTSWRYASITCPDCHGAGRIDTAA